MKEMNFTHKVWKSFVVSFFVSCYLVGNQHQEVVIFFGKAREAKECESEGAESSRDVALVIWLKWKFLALACNGLQSRDVVITHSRYEAVEASLWPHPSIFISLLYTGRVHTGNPLFKTAVVYVDFLLLDFSYVVLYLYCCLVLVLHVSEDQVIE